MVMIMARAPLHYPMTHLATPPPAPAPALVGAGPVPLRLGIPVRTSRTASTARLAVDPHGLLVCKEKVNSVSIFLEQLQFLHPVIDICTYLFK